MNVLADEISGVVGTITMPNGFQNVDSTSGGFAVLFSNILRLVFVAAGIFAFINFIIAGFEYMSAAGDSKKLSAALDRIWYSLLGLVVLVGSFALTAVVSQLFFGNPTYILNPTITGPK